MKRGHDPGPDMKRGKTDLKTFDHSFPCAHCGYKIPPSELLRTDWDHVLCPKCSKESVYTPKKG